MVESTNFSVLCRLQALLQLARASPPAGQGPAKRTAASLYPLSTFLSSPGGPAESSRGRTCQKDGRLGDKGGRGNWWLSREEFVLLLAEKVGNSLPSALQTRRGRLSARPMLLPRRAGGTWEAAGATRANISFIFWSGEEQGGLERGLQLCRHHICGAYRESKREPVLEQLRSHWHCLQKA